MQVYQNIQITMKYQEVWTSFVAGKTPILTTICKGNCFEDFTYKKSAEDLLSVDFPSTIAQYEWYSFPHNTNHQMDQ